MEQFIADITKEFNLNPEGVALYKKMFEDAVVSGKQMYGTEEEATAFAVRVVRTAFEDEEDEKAECDNCGELAELHEHDGHAWCEKCVDEYNEEETCCFAGCEKAGTHEMSHGEYHYCDEHYDGHVVGECHKCGIEIHDSWDWTAMACGDFCRPCAKQHHNKKCDECFSDQESDDEEYECYCQECGEVIEGMTEEEFEEDDELKLCAKCEEVYKVDGLDEFPKMFAELVAGGMSEKEAGRVLAKGVISAVRSALDKAE